MTDPTILYSGKGKLYISGRDSSTGAPTGYDDIGNCSALTISPSVTTFSHEESRTGKNLVDKTIISSVAYGFSMTLDSVAKEALELYMYATTSTSAGASVTDEAATAVHDKAFKLTGSNITAGSIVVTNDTGVTTYVLDTDYVIDDETAGLIRVLSTGAITDGQALLVDYTNGATETINPAAGQANIEKRIMFAGLNRARDNSPVTVEFYKVQLEQAQEWTLINDEEFASFQINGQILLDTLQPASTGQFMQITQLQTP